MIADNETMADKLMYMNIPNDNTHNYPFFRLQLVFETFGHSTIQPIKIHQGLKSFQANE